ncbi:MAG: ADP-ribosylglycohydrolase family protein, partial [Salinisphaera sp.]|nr:ADP-ribosylglycohydrolase family protein [Salinisphaera sp.]
NRVQGALLGAFIGDALALGPHWYYDLDALRRDYGQWIDDYTDPRPDRYHGGMRAGQSSQSGWLLELTLQSLVDCGGYDEADFCHRLDRDFFPLIDASPHGGPGGFTSQSMREAWALRVRDRQPWGQVGGYADNTEAAERTLGIAVRYAPDPGALARHVSANTALTQIDPTVGAMTTAYGCALGLLVGGARFDDQISTKLMTLVRAGKLPFHTVTKDGQDNVAAGPSSACTAGHFASPDALLGMGSIARAARDPDVRIEPACKAAQVYGMPCSVYHQFPAAYYLAARFADDFEAAVLHAVNGGGQNMSRAMLTGALVGAMVGIHGIPARFIDGLERGQEYVALARQIAGQ